MKQLTNIAATAFMVVAFCFSNNVFAQDIERYRLPEGKRCEVSGEVYQCFDLEEYKELLRMDQDLKNFVEYTSILEQELILLENKVNRLDDSLSIAMDIIDRQEEENQRLFEKWKKENKLRLEAEHSPDISSWLGWGLAAAEAAVILGIVTVLLVN